MHVDGHDPEAIAARARAGAEVRPPDDDRLQDDHRLRRAASKAGTSKAHGEPLGAEELAGARRRSGWADGRSRARRTISRAWREAGRDAAGAAQGMAERLRPRSTPTRAPSSSAA